MHVLSAAVGSLFRPRSCEYANTCGVNGHSAALRLSKLRSPSRLQSLLDYKLMDDTNPSSQNPFTPPKSEDTPPVHAGRPVHPLLVIAVFLLSLGVGGCVFFCSCLGVVIALPRAGPGILWLCVGLALAATVATFFGGRRLLRRLSDSASYSSGIPAPPVDHPAAPADED